MQKIDKWVVLLSIYCELLLILLFSPSHAVQIIVTRFCSVDLLGQDGGGKMADATNLPHRSTNLPRN